MHVLFNQKIYLFSQKKMINECKYMGKRVGKALELKIYKIYTYKR